LNLAVPHCGDVLVGFLGGPYLGPAHGTERHKLL